MDYIASFKAVFTNHSAVSCLVGARANGMLPEVGTVFSVEVFPVLVARAQDIIRFRF